MGTKTKALVAVTKGSAKLVLGVAKGTWAVSSAIVDGTKAHKERREAKQHEANERELTKLLLDREKKRLKEERR